jgi:hypothetical protein
MNSYIITRKKIGEGLEIQIFHSKVQTELRASRDTDKGKLSVPPNQDLRLYT